MRDKIDSAWALFILVAVAIDWATLFDALATALYASSR